ncbi:MAG TPA: hypothetical protein VNL12_02380 [Iamia sp.]|nr:hypothetical protein [Iamia sp.]
MRSAAFAVAFMVLVAAVPALGWVGKERLLDSRGGDFVEDGVGPTDPGYEALVEPTQIALVIQRAEDGDGPPVTATVLSLGAGREGGSVLQIPLDTRVREQVFFVDRLAATYEYGGEELFVSEVEDRLGVAIPVVIDLADDSLESLVGPVAPLEIDNADTVVLESGKEIPPDPVDLLAEEVGPFLRATIEGESELGRLERNRVVWSTWLAAIGQSSTADSIGAATTGIGPFLRTLADGEPVVETLDVEPPSEVGPDPDYTPPFVPAEGFEEQIIAAVPYPGSPGEGRRWTMKLLNGVSGDEIPRALVRELILDGAALTTLGNAADFGRERTLIEYSDATWEAEARSAGEVLGDTAEVRRMSRQRAESEGDDLVITLGQDALDHVAEREAGADGG